MDFGKSQNLKWIKVIEKYLLYLLSIYCILKTLFRGEDNIEFDP